LIVDHVCHDMKNENSLFMNIVWVNNNFCVVEFSIVSTKEFWLGYKFLEIFLFMPILGILCFLAIDMILELAWWFKVVN